MEFLRPTFVHIHLDRLADNFRTLRSFNPENEFICPMIKANAYGHGDIAVAKALGKAQCQHFGVASVEEGLHLREHHVTEEILVFGFTGKEAVRSMIENKLTPVVSDFDQLSDLTNVVREPINVHVKVDTGMHRLGFQEQEIAGLIRVLEKNEKIHLVGMGTHFHSGGDLHIDQSSAWQQNQLFEKIIANFAGRSLAFHAYNSAAIASLYKKRKGFKFGFRPGLLVYGVDPEDNLSLKPLVSPVMEFKSKIVAIQQVKSGEVVSYGGTWQAPKDSVIGIVPAGYADGVSRSLSNRGEFLVQGKRVPIRGRVCMDYTMVDLSEISPISRDFRGEEVVLFGKQGGEEITVEELARAANSINYEVMTGIGERVPRMYGAVK